MARNKFEVIFKCMMGSCGPYRERRRDSVGTENLRGDAQVNFDGFEQYDRHG